MNNEPKKILTAEQAALVAELVETYEIEPETILFYDDTPKPFLSYETSSVLCNYLANISAIDVEPVPSVSDDSISVRCSLTLHDGRVRSAVGVANSNEQINDTEASSQQLYNLAASRALRNALRSAGIDLIKRHYAAKRGDDSIEFQLSSNSEALLKQAHALGREKYLIVGNNKTLWYHTLWTRYHVQHSNELNEQQRADFVAYLKTFEPNVIGQPA